MGWIEGAWNQRHIYIQLDVTIAPHLDIWDLRPDSTWQQTRRYLHPVHVALQEMARRNCPPHQPSGWGL